MKIAMTSVFVEDPVAAHEYYTETLGFQSLHHPETGLAVVVSPEQPDGTALLLEPRGDSFAKTYQEAVYEKGLPAIVFGAEDVPAEVERLRAKGVAFRDDLAKPEWGLDNLFEDGQGNILMLFAPPAGS